MGCNDAQRYTDDHADKCGEGHLGEGLHGLLPVTEIEYQQEGEGDKEGETGLALDVIGKQRKYSDQRQGVEPEECAGKRGDDARQRQRYGVENSSTMLCQPFDIPGDMFTQWKLFLV